MTDHIADIGSGIDAGKVRLVLILMLMLMLMPKKNACCWASRWWRMTTMLVLVLTHCLRPSSDHDQLTSRSPPSSSISALSASAENDISMLDITAAVARIKWCQQSAATTVGKGKKFRSNGRRLLVGGGTKPTKLTMFITPSSIALHGIELYCLVLHGIACYCMILHGVTWYCMVLYYIAWYCVDTKLMMFIITPSSSTVATVA